MALSVIFHKNMVNQVASMDLDLSSIGEYIVVCSCCGNQLTPAVPTRLSSLVNHAGGPRSGKFFNSECGKKCEDQPIIIKMRHIYSSSGSQSEM